jgi:NAD(P)-dependent dehydrogenase (short-subunit alcohol dehydrogenase family)
MLTGKVAIVTGSSAGIGAAIAKELSAQGASVVINYPFAKLKSEADLVLSELHTPSLAVEADLSTTTGPQQLIEAAIKKFGKIDILVNNASIALNKPLEELTLDDWDKMVNLNGRGYFLMVQGVLSHLNNPSRIINIVSASSRTGPPAQTIYAGTKGMQDSFTRVWAQELPRKYGCTVNAISPGPTRYV